MIPVFVGAWRSLVAHLHGVQGVGGSNPLAPTNHNSYCIKSNSRAGVSPRRNSLRKHALNALFLSAHKSLVHRSLTRLTLGVYNYAERFCLDPQGPGWIH